MKSTLSKVQPKARPAVKPFQNLPVADFQKAGEREKLEAAQRAVHGSLGRDYPLRLGGENRATGDWVVSRDPGNPQVVVGRAARADAGLIDQAVEAAARAFESWRRVPHQERARLLFKTAALFRRQRYELDAWIILEAGKTWVEADADTAEAIDFLEFYGRDMLRYGQGQRLAPVAGEDNRLDYRPLGVVAVIPPWNFPAAILTGMAAAAIVAGNTVVLKPSSETPVAAAKVVELFERAGLPPGVLNFVPGSGAAVGDGLVGHPRVRAIAFTGSMEVGLRLNELAARTPAEQPWIKRVIAEMGGKNAILVDETADLDLAAKGVVASAFGYQGQKCSACSRLVAVEAIYDGLLEKVAARAQALRVGHPQDPQVQMGPVISEPAMQKILGFIELGRGEGKVVLGGERARVPGFENGFYLQPTIFSEVGPTARIAQEEIFGPVLACLRAPDFEAALEIANGTRFGLTGSVYSRNRARLEHARAEFHAGNLYFNRKCTGALVGGHPFGGFNRSGTDSKAGGRDYLLLFLQAKVVSEKLGAAPAQRSAGKGAEP
ncbi:MAG: L-glutamate gamma-semialdehyde dehydrogenase [Planctomycetes bacterium]|nr:L-glutamate gamma-semialdehyde dehydrogenase [Planctomycetota bacterium]